jgi:hypothetical protein
MAYEYPPIVRLAERLLLTIEEVVRQFPRYHKYTIGSELRQQAMSIMRLCHRAWHDKKQQSDWLKQLIWAIDDLKISLQLGKQIKAFKSFKQFEQLVLLIGELGKQSGGWYKQYHQKEQQTAPVMAQPRLKTLSTHTSSVGEQP